MDSLSHGLVGLAVAGISGHPLSIHDPIYLSVLLGAQAPDFDIITRLKGNLTFLKQHRAFSHSIPGILIWSALITFGIHKFMPAAPLMSSFFWALIGGLSHILLDYFNTHGTSLFWPIQKRRKSCQLLNVVDPILLTLMLGLYAFHLPMQYLSVITLTIIGVYIALRITSRHRATSWLEQHLGSSRDASIAVMPSLKHIFSWDFVIETTDRYFVGRIGALHPNIEICADLPKKDISAIAIQAQKTVVGDFFRTFTPFIYFEEEFDAQSKKVNIYDLRYYLNNQFLHSATVIFDIDNTPADSYMYSWGNKIKVPC